MVDFLLKSWDEIKQFVLLLITALISICTPIEGVLLLLFGGFLFNIASGFIADVHVNKADFSIKKAFEAIIHLTFYMALVMFIHIVFSVLKDFELGQTAVKWVTYVVIYFYLTNVMRNAKLVFPKNKTIQLLYSLLTTQVFLKLREFVGLKKNSNTEEGSYEREK